MRWRSFLPFLGLGLAFWALRHLDLHALHHALRRLSVPAVLLASTAMAINVGLKVIRWKRLLDSLNITITMGTATSAFIEAAFWGSLTPGRMGEFSRVARLRLEHPPAGVLASCLFDRGLDLGVLLCVGSLGYVGVVHSPALAAGLGVVACVCLALTTLLSRSTPPPTARGSKTMQFVRTTLHDMKVFFGTPVLIEALLWTFIAWVAYFSVGWIYAHAMHLDVPFGLLFSASAFAGLSTLLPITYQGVGARELIFALMLARAGVIKEDAVALSLVSIATILGTTLCMGLVEMVTRPLWLKNAP